MLVKRFLVIIRFIFLPSLLIVLNSCDASPNMQKPPVSSPTSISVVLPTDNTERPHYKDGSTEIGRQAENSNIQINLSGFYCIPYSGSPGFYPYISAYYPHENLVLAAKDTSYDAAEIQQTQDYLNEVNQHIGDFFTWNPPNPPRTLQWLPGGVKCIAILEITNKRDTNTEVYSFGLQLTKPPILNSNVYRQVNFCLTHDCYGPGGGRGNCSYNVSLALSGGLSGASFEQAINGSELCPEPLIVPAGKTAEIYVTIQDLQKQSLIYQVVPFLQIPSANGEEKVMFPSLTNDLYFTENNDFPCYALEGNTFEVQNKYFDTCQ